MGDSSIIVGHNNSETINTVLKITSAVLFMKNVETWTWLRLFVINHFIFRGNRHSPVDEGLAIFKWQRTLPCAGYKYIVLEPQVDWISSGFRYLRESRLDQKAIYSFHFILLNLSKNGYHFNTITIGYSNCSLQLF